MITRIFIPILLAIILSDTWLFRRYVRRKSDGKVRKVRCALLLLPSLLMIAATVALVVSKDFAPRDFSLMNAYLFFLATIVVPKTMYALCTFLGFLTSRIVRAVTKRTQHPPRNYGRIAGVIVVAAIRYVAVYGCTTGFSQVTVRHVEYKSPDLPASFDGYRIVHFSDAHVGTYDASRQHLLQQFVDSINAQCADAIVFTGDLQNREPQEIYPHLKTLSSLRAVDGVYSVLGNHDYSNYIHADPSTCVANERETMRLEKQMGWTLLVNDHHSICRANDSIVIAGMDNDGDGVHFPQKGKVTTTLKGVDSKAFVIMLQHDPTAWRRKILPESNAQLTLSGHTHAMQFAIFGWSPIRLIYSEWGGMFYEGSRAINVSTGMGGFIPFRFGVPGEIVVITLKRIKELKD